MTVPEGFPRDPWPAAVPGAQKKFSARLINGRYVVGLTDEELAERFELCEDLVQQLVAYCKRKWATSPCESQEAFLAQLEAGVRAQDLDVSPVEITWMMARVRERLCS